MKKFFKIFCIVILCILTFTIVVSAHSGRTDSSGGHYNHSTGEYHYHHGESAHDHYDIDGDGEIDCPRDFNYIKAFIACGGIKSFFGIIALLLISAVNALIIEMLLVAILSALSVDVQSCKKFFVISAIVLFVISIILTFIL